MAEKRSTYRDVRSKSAAFAAKANAVSEPHMKVKRTRIKACSRCSEIKTALFRVQIEKDGDWIFVCRACLDEVRPKNQNYRYGGTWKSKKRH